MGRNQTVGVGRVSHSQNLDVSVGVVVDGLAGANKDFSIILQ